MERLAELELLTGRPESAARLRARKAELDRAKIDYESLVTEPSAVAVQHCVEMARLAEVLGRWFEARSLWSVVGERSPSDREAREARTRLEGTRVPRAGLTLAGLLAELGPAPATHRTRSLGRFSTVPAFSDDALVSGLCFRFDNGATPSKQLPETMSGGVGLLDYDGDGWLDAYLVQGGPFPPSDNGSALANDEHEVAAKPNSGDRYFATGGTAHSRMRQPRPASPISRRATATEWPSGIMTTMAIPTFSSRAGAPTPCTATKVTGLFGM